MGDEYEILVADKVRGLLDGLDEKSKRIVRENLENLSQPYPPDGTGDKKKITGVEKDIYRLHIGRTWTAFYEISDEGHTVYVLDLMSIEEAHKKYGRLE